MASMGWLLLIAISLSLVCTMVVLPALLVLRYRGGAVTNAPKSS
jgi:predicted RND superfamily exporter protein